MLDMLYGVCIMMSLQLGFPTRNAVWSQRAFGTTGLEALPAMQQHMRHLHLL